MKLTEKNVIQDWYIGISHPIPNVATRGEPMSKEHIKSQSKANIIFLILRSCVILTCAEPRLRLVDCRVRIRILVSSLPCAYTEKPLHIRDAEHYGTKTGQPRCIFEVYDGMFTTSGKCILVNRVFDKHPCDLEPVDDHELTDHLTAAIPRKHENDMAE